MALSLRLTSRRAITRASLLLTLALLGCASGYKEFYRPAPGATPEVIARIRQSPPPVTPIVERSQPGDPQAILDVYAKRGYALIGSSLFNSGKAESEDSAVRQGQAVGADLVLIFNPKYTGSVTASMPVTTPTTTTSYSSGTATAYGSGGSVTAYGSGTTTTYGTTTNYVPITVHRSDYGAAYFVKQWFSLGVFTRDLNDGEREELQTNKGAVIRLIADNTPAFNADLLVGDIVVAVDGVTVSNTVSFYQMLANRRGKLIMIELLRRGKKIEKQIQLN